MALYDNHKTCRECRKSKGRVCDKILPCSVCSLWTVATCALHEKLTTDKQTKEHQKRARKAKAMAKELNQNVSKTPTARKRRAESAPEMVSKPGSSPASMIPGRAAQL